MNEIFKEYLNIISLVAAVIVSAFVIITEQQRFFVGLTVAGIVAGLALSFFSTFLCGVVVKVCVFIITLMFATKVFKIITKW